MPDETTPHAASSTAPGEPACFPPHHQQEERSTLRSIFLGKQGLRAGWSILLFSFFIAAFNYACFAALIHFHVVPRHMNAEKNGIPATVGIVSELVQLVCVVLAAFIMGRIEKRSFAQYGLGPVQPRLGQFTAGLLWGFTLLSLLVGLLWKTGLLVFTGTLLHGSAILQWSCVWAVQFLLVGVFEEFFSRGYLQFTLTRGIEGIANVLRMETDTQRILGFWVAALFMSFLFGFGHKGNPGESPIGLWSAGLIGLVFCFSLWRTGSLWWAIGFHAAWDWAQSFLFGVADSGTMVLHHLESSHPQGTVLLSGGLTGPEGSVYVLGIIFLAAMIVAVTLKPQPGSPSLLALDTME